MAGLNPEAVKGPVDRDANSALWRVALVRMRCHEPTKDYVTRRTTEGKTKTEIMHCLKRYIAREAFNLLAGEAATMRTLAMIDGCPRRKARSDPRRQCKGMIL